MLIVTAQADGVRFRVKVAPRAAREAIGGEHDGALKVSLTAPPVEGEANQALCALLAKRLGVAKRDVVIVQGQSAKLKTVSVAGVSAEAVHALVG
ncbi:MAG TPA: DUF167 domain-containing protein [Polyangiales bacterium]